MRREEMIETYYMCILIFFFFMFQIITTFSVVDNMKEQFYAQQGKISRFGILAITSPVFLLLYDFFWVTTFPQNGLLVFP